MVADRTYATQEALTATTMTSSTFADKLTKTIVSADLASSTWVFHACGQQDSGATTASTAIRLRNDTDGTNYRDQIQEPSSATAHMPFGLWHPATFGAAPGDKTFKIQQASQDNTTTCGSSNLRFTAIKLRGNDTVVTAAGPFNPPSSGWSTILTWTAPANGTYDVVMGGRLAFVSTSNVPAWRVLDTDGTTVLRQVADVTSATLPQNKDATDVFNPVTMVTKTMTTGQTLLFQIGKNSITAANQIWTNAFGIGFDAAEWPDRFVSSTDSSMTAFTNGSSNEWADVTGISTAYSVGDVSDYFGVIHFNFSFITASSIGVRSQPTIGGLPLMKWSGTSNTSGTATGMGGHTMGLVLPSRSTPIGIEALIGTGSGSSFPIDSFGGMGAVYKLKAGSGPPNNSPHATTRAAKIHRQRAQQLGIAA